MNPWKFKFNTSFLLSSIVLNASSIEAQETRYQYLSGIDKDHTVTWGFYINIGMKNGSWNKIQIPSDTKSPDESGQYKYNFNVSFSDADKTVFIVFETSMTDADIKINGKLAGPIHWGGLYWFKHDSSSLLHFGADNLLEVTINKRYSNASTNQVERKADRALLANVLPAFFGESSSILAQEDSFLRSPIRDFTSWKHAGNWCQTLISGSKKMEMLA